jgi:hypothetical protein
MAVSWWKQTIQRNISEGGHFHIRVRENLKFHVVVVLLFVMDVGRSGNGQFYPFEVRRRRREVEGSERHYVCCGSGRCFDMGQNLRRRLARVG